jgi:predicted phosphodiesterase
VRTAIVSDLHLGTVTDADVARYPEPRERLLAAIQDADRVVLLGDVLELRERPLAELLELVKPFFRALGEVTAGREVVLVPGNHDYQLAEPLLARVRLEGNELALETEREIESGEGAPGRLAEWMPETRLRLAYPGLRLRTDVYAIHGHYLDFLLTVPRIESLAASVMGRLAGRRKGCDTVADYEAVLSPLYSLFFALAQGAPAGRLRRGSGLSRKVWQSLNGRGRPVTRVLLGRVTIPGTVAVLNRTGFGPFSAEISGVELRRAGLKAMSQVADALGIDAEHVIFGHTHRPGPLPSDDPAEWSQGRQLWNSGSWLYESAFLRGEGSSNPYWPGCVVTLEDEGPPRLENVLRDVALPAR